MNQTDEHGEDDFMNLIKKEYMLTEKLATTNHFLPIIVTIMTVLF